MRATQLLEGQEQALLAEAAKVLFDELKNDGYSMVRSYVRMEAGLSPFSSEDDAFTNPLDPPKTPDPENMEELIQDWCENRVAEVYYEISYLARNGAIPAWRVITAPPTWTPEGRHPGIYWAWDQDAAEAHWGDGNQDNVTWEMTANLPVSIIDWVTTLVMNANPSYEQECEIRVNKDAPIEVISCRRLD